MTPPINVLIISADRDYAFSLAMEMRTIDPKMDIGTCVCTKNSFCGKDTDEIDVLVFDCNMLRESNGVLEHCLQACNDIPCIALVHSDDVVNLPMVLEHSIEIYLNKSRPIPELAKLLVQRTSSLVDLHHAEEIRKRTEKRLRVLVELAQTRGSSFNDIADFVLKKMVELTDSEMGYLAFLEGKGGMLRMHAWSEKGVEKCRVPHKPILYSMDEVGIWGEPIRQGKPIVLNDFAAEHPLKRGVPQGHVEIDRYMAVPICHNGEIVATAGVANKSSPYNESDVEQIGLLMDGMISIQHGIEMRREIVEAQGKYQALLDSLPYTVAVLDEHSRVLSINKTPPGTNLDTSEIIGLRLMDRKTEAGIQYNAIFQKTKEKNALVRQEAVLNAEDGQIIHLDVGIAPVPINDTNSKLYIATINDITDIRQALLNMHKATHKMQLMESMTYHDIFNQIQIMRGYLELMSSDDGRSEKDLRMFNAVETAAVNISEQMKLLRDYYALGLTSPDWLDLEEQLKRAIGGSGLNPGMLKLNCSGINVLADNSFYKAFYNLYHNSISHGEKVTRVTIDYEQLPDGTLRLIYQDDGVGIPADKKEKIFLRGFGNHTGLGMFLVREIFHICGFTIIETGTQGARFEICMPAGRYRLASDPMA